MRIRYSAPSTQPGAILVPSATRLKMSLTSSSGHTQNFEFFHWLTKNQCAAEIEITKLYAFQFTSGPMTVRWRTLRKKSKTNDGDRSRSIRSNRKSFHVTKNYNAYNDVLLDRNHRLLMEQPRRWEKRLKLCESLTIS